MGHLVRCAADSLIWKIQKLLFYWLNLGISALSRKMIFGENARSFIHLFSQPKSQQTLGGKLGNTLHRSPVSRSMMKLCFWSYEALSVLSVFVMPSSCEMLGVFQFLLTLPENGKLRPSTRVKVHQFLCLCLNQRALLLFIREPRPERFENRAEESLSPSYTTTGATRPTSLCSEFSTAKLRHRFCGIRKWVKSVTPDWLMAGFFAVNQAAYGEVWCDWTPYASLL